jgi:hypothetical protein
MQYLELQAGEERGARVAVAAALPAAARVAVGAAAGKLISHCIFLVFWISESECIIITGQNHNTNCITTAAVSLPALFLIKSLIKAASLIADGAPFAQGPRPPPLGAPNPLTVAYGGTGAASWP